MDVYRTWILIILFTLLNSSVVLAQNAKGKLSEKNLTFARRGVRLDSLFKKIKQQTGFVFSYNAKKVNQSVVVDISPGKYSVEEMLVKITTLTGLDYSISENHIILKSAKPPLTSQVSITIPVLKTTTIKKTKEIEPANTAKEAKPTPLVTETEQDKNVTDKNITAVTLEPAIQEKQVDTVNIKKALNINRDSVNLSPAKAGQKKVDSDSVKRVAAVQITPKSVDQKESITAKKTITPKQRTRQSFGLKAGFSSDETFYAGASVQLGVPLIYATAGFKTDFTVGIFSYGLGTSFKVTSRLRANIFVNTGSISKTFHIFSKVRGDTSTQVGDTALVNYTVAAKSKLLRVGISLEKKLTPKLTLQASLQFNSLSTHYLVDGTAASIGYWGSNEDKKIYTVRPPYLFKNSYGPNTDANKKYWVGIQLSLLYTITFPRRG